MPFIGATIGRVKVDAAVFRLMTVAVVVVDGPAYTNLPFPPAIPSLTVSEVVVRSVHDIPSVLVATALVAAGKVFATATKYPLAYVTEVQSKEAGIVLAVHDEPLVDDAAAVVAPSLSADPTATKTPAP